MNRNERHDTLTKVMAGINNGKDLLKLTPMSYTQAALRLDKP
jgi:hypothetical protein